MDFEFLVQNIIISLVTIRNEALDNQKIDLKTQMQWYEQGAVAGSTAQQNGTNARWYSNKTK